MANDVANHIENPKTLSISDVANQIRTQNAFENTADHIWYDPRGHFCAKTRMIGNLRFGRIPYLAYGPYPDPISGVIPDRIWFASSDLGGDPRSDDAKKTIHIMEQGKVI